MTTPALDLEGIMPRSWVAESATGKTGEWLVISSGKPNPTNARSMALSGGVWTISVAWYGDIDCQLRYDDGSGSTMLGIIPAASPDGPPQVLTVQAPLKKNGAIHIQTRGATTVGSRAAITAIPIPLNS